MGVAEDLFHYGRERRHTYWTLPAFQALITRENLPYDRGKNAHVVNLNVSTAGGFSSFDDEEFYDDADPSALSVYVDTFNKSTTSGEPTKMGRPRKYPLILGPNGPKRGRPPKRKAEELAGGEDIEEAPTPKSRKRAKAKKQAEELEEPPAPKKIGRPKKITDLRSATDPEPNPVPKKRGRPRKQPVVDNAGDEIPATPVAPKRRGRPPKNKDKQNNEEAIANPQPNPTASPTRVSTRTLKGKALSVDEPSDPLLSKPAPVPHSSARLIESPVASSSMAPTPPTNIPGSPSVPSKFAVNAAIAPSSEVPVGHNISEARPLSSSQVRPINFIHLHNPQFFVRRIRCHQIVKSGLPLLVRHLLLFNLQKERSMLNN